jgi:hypothetical protein
MTAPAQQMASFADPAAVGGTRPAIRDLVGRTVVIRPTRYEPNAPAIKPGETQERITADILIVDGGPLDFGGNLVTANKPHTYRVATPYLARGVYISNTNIVASVKDSTGKAPVLGSIAMGITNTPGNNAPYNLLRVEETSPQYAMAGQLYTQVLNETFVNPTPASIGAAPIATPAQPVAPAPAAPAAVDPQAAYQAWLASQQAPAAPAVASLPPAPAGWNADVWAGLEDAQRQQVLDSMKAATPF